MMGPAGFGQAPNTGVGRNLCLSQRDYQPGGVDECPLCGTLRHPKTVRKDGSATYVCAPDKFHHRKAHTWRLDAHGNLVH